MVEFDPPDQKTDNRDAGPTYRPRGWFFVTIDAVAGGMMGITIAEIAAKAPHYIGKARTLSVEDVISGTAGALVLGVIGHKINQAERKRNSGETDPS
jgi:hypothetical protein